MAQKKDYDKLLFRLTSILSKLSANELPTINELSEEFNVSKRTIQRDIYDRMIAFPIEVNKHKQLHFTDGFSLNRTRLNVEEVTTITLALELIKNKGDEFNRASEQLMNKFLHESVFNPYYIKPFSSEQINTDSSLLNAIEEAIEFRNRMDVEFNDGRIKVLEPLKIINFEGYWYLLAKDEEKIKTFLISNIKTVNVSYAKFEAPANEKALLNTIHTPFFTQDSEIEVTIEVAKEIAHYFELKEHLPSQQIVSRDEAGNLTIEYVVTHLEEIDNLVKSWLPHISVISPQSYRAQIADELSGYLQSIS